MEVSGKVLIFARSAKPAGNEWKLPAIFLHISRFRASGGAQYRRGDYEPHRRGKSYPSSVPALVLKSVKLESLSPKVILSFFSRFFWREEKELFTRQSTSLYLA